jgi:hypothetical protein
MTKALPALVRRLVLLALAPSPCAACRPDVVTDRSEDAAATDAAGATSQVPGFPGDACVGDPDGASCAPQWIDGDGSAPAPPVGGGMSYLGAVLWPCGLPPIPSSSGSSSSGGTVQQGTQTFSCGEVCFGAYGECIEYDLCGNGIGYAENAGSTPFWRLADSGTAPVIFSCYEVSTGRRPTGWRKECGGEVKTLGEVLVRAAHLESASVDAFFELAGQLTTSGAPRRLIRRLLRAAVDEVRHSRRMGELARMHGGWPAPVQGSVEPPRSLIEIAVANAREGCVRETWGAACAVAQAELAAEENIRAVMKSIARDELRHAALSWDLDAWLARRLGAEDRARVAAERASAINALERDIEREAPPAMRAAMGFPPRDVARAIFASMRENVWATA